MQRAALDLTGDEALGFRLVEHGSQAAPAHHREYARVFAGAERFSQSFTGIEFPRKLLDVRQLHHDPRLYALIHAEARRSIDTVARGPTPGRSVQEAAVATGFSDCTAFHRAFKHWTGVTRVEFQRRSAS